MNHLLLADTIDLLGTLFWAGVFITAMAILLLAAKWYCGPKQTGKRLAKRLTNLLRKKKQ